MVKETKNVIQLSEANEHLADIFSDNLYLELGTIPDRTINELLQRKPVDYRRLADFEMVKKGIGSMSMSSKEMAYLLPFMYFQNIARKNKNYQLVLTYGLYFTKKGYKEFFVPMILIPVEMYFMSDAFMFQMISEPFPNPYLKSSNKEKHLAGFIELDNFNSIYAFDRFIFNYAKHQMENVRLENYLTFVATKTPEALIRHEKFHLASNLSSSRDEAYLAQGVADNYFITQLDMKQRYAVYLAGVGRSFAVTGYEGSGKTTTLINIAADAVKKGKRVLYVSNSENTLDTVYKTYQNCGLATLVSNFTLPFSLVNVKDAEPKRGQILAEILKGQLINQYQSVSQYEKLLSTKIKNFPLIEIMKELILTPKPETLFPESIMGPAYLLYKPEISEVLKALAIIDCEIVKIASLEKSHFANITPQHQIKSVNEPMHLLEQMFLNFNIIKGEKDFLEKNFGFANIRNYAHLSSQIGKYKKLNKDNVPGSWLQDYKNEHMKAAFPHFIRAKQLFPLLKEEITKSLAIKKEISSAYNITKEYDVNLAINEILADKFTRQDEKEINQLLADYLLVSEELSHALRHANALERYFAKMKAKLEIDIDLNDKDAITKITDLLMVLDEGYFTRVWCDFEQAQGICNKMANIEDILDSYYKSLDSYNQVFESMENLDANIKLLEKRHKDSSSKYKGKNVEQLLNDAYNIRTYLLKIRNLKKEYKNITNADYTYQKKISLIYKKFIAKHQEINDQALLMHLDRFLQTLRGSGINDILDIVKGLNDEIEYIEKEYTFFENYKIIASSDYLAEKIKNLRDLYPYVDVIFVNQQKMKEILVVKKEPILFSSYLYLQEKRKERSFVLKKIDDNKEYKYLYQKLFASDLTDVNLLSATIEDFNSYLDVFSAASAMVETFGPEDAVILERLSHIKEVIDEIGLLFQQHAKMFKTGTSKFYYDDLKTVIAQLQVLIDNREELEVYLKITEQVKVLLKHKLFNLYNYIFYHHKEKVMKRFKYSYFKHYYDEFTEKNHSALDISELENTLQSIIVREGDLIKSNISALKLAPERGFRTGRAAHLAYNRYIMKNKGSKMIFLADSKVVNTFLDVTLFDLVLIDDAHMLKAGEYYKLMDASQVIMAGVEYAAETFSSNLIARIRDSATIKLKYRYTKTPLDLLLQMKDIKGQFYSDVKLNNGIMIWGEHINPLLLKLIKDKTNKINFYTASLSLMHKTYSEIGNVLYDQGWTSFEIDNFFFDTLNISDLKESYPFPASYNILDLSSYYLLNDAYLAMNMVNNLLSCGKKLIIYDPKKILSERGIKTEFMKRLNNILKPAKPKFYLPRGSLVEKTALSLYKSRIKTLGVYLPLNLVVEYDKKYFGIMIVPAPDMTDFLLLNSYRRFKTMDFPVTLVWLSDLINDYDKAIQRIVKEIKS